MIYESDRSLATVDGYAAYYVVAVSPVVDIQKGVAVDNLGVFYFQTVNGIDVVNNLVVGLFYRVRLSEVYTLFESFVYIGSYGALFGCQK